MGKSSGGTRNSTPQSTSANDTYRPEDMDRIAAMIARGGIVSFERADNDIWTEQMDVEERELTLMLAGFTGLTNEELETFGTIYTPLSKKDLMSEAEEALVNEWMGYGMDDSTMYSIGYKDGTVKTVSHLDNDVEPIRAISSNAVSNTYYNVARQSLRSRDIAFIVRSNGYNEPNYYATKEGMAHLKRWGGFEEWKNGRGERRRSYIQDDWI